ncbi:MAG: toll/interleukin-1 receptor domain-containing protein [Iphinoe sp. HA4291-MV1]|jgi:hypothetical protein|nr:toll/interleukin-1 receptor domain-containing protein [Iphinoe sp. HA4291-MV1]
MTLTLKDLIKNGILNELASLFHEQEMADILLDLIDFPVAMRPIFPNNGRILGYWREICNQIQSGAVREGTDLQPLIDATIEIYPANPVFHPYCSDRTQPNNPNNHPSNTSRSSNTEAYDPRMFQDSTGRGRRVVIDGVNKDSSTERLNHDQILGDANIQEEDNLESIVFPTLSNKSYQSKRQLQVFLCHSSDDKPTVRELYKQLLNEEFQPWLDEENILPGQNWELEIKKAVQSADVIIICLSKNSVNKIGYIQKEIKFALDIAERQPEGSIFIVPMKIDNCNVPQRLSDYQWLDWFTNPAVGYIKLLKALKHRAKELGFNQ